MHKVWPPLDDAQKVAVEQNYRLVLLAASKADRHFKGAFHYDELLSAAHMALIRAVQTYDPSKAAFSTHFFMRFKHETSLLIYKSRPLGLRRSGAFTDDVVVNMSEWYRMFLNEYEIPLHVDDDGPKRVDDRDEVRVAMRVISPAHRQAVRAKFGLGPPLAGTSRSTVDNRARTAIKHMRKHIRLHGKSPLKQMVGPQTCR